MKILNILADEDAEIEDVIECDALDEALAIAFADAPPGHIVSVHMPGCETNGVDPDTCTCEPDEYIVGAKA